MAFHLILCLEELLELRGKSCWWVDERLQSRLRAYHEASTCTHKPDLNCAPVRHRVDWFSKQRSYPVRAQGVDSVSAGPRDGGLHVSKPKSSTLSPHLF